MIIESSEWASAVLEVKDRVRKAFAGVSLGGGIGLREGQAIDYYEPEAVRLSYRESDEKDDWARISIDELNSCSSSLSFFDAEGMRFHLPAYLLADLDDLYNFSMVETLSQVFGSQEQFALLSGDQRAAVVSYLELCERRGGWSYDRPIIRRAIDEYWLR